jgi:hypothetical protein
VTSLAESRARLASATELPAILDAATTAFERILAVLRHHQEQAGPAFAAFTLAAGAAADGRDDLYLAKATLRAGTATTDVLDGQPWPAVAAEVAVTGLALAARLQAAAADAGPQDKARCQSAAASATRICQLLGGASQP